MSATIAATVYISIGNSDDKLTQAQWAEFYEHVDSEINGWADDIHGRWVSASTDAFQNACWCVETGHARELQTSLANLALIYHQDSVAWAEAETTFIEAARPIGSESR